MHSATTRATVRPKRGIPTCSNAATACSPPSISRAASRRANITPEGVVDLCAAAIAAREDEVGAFTHLDIDGARAHARENAERLRAPPLRGLPVGLKDIYDTADMPTEYGSAAYKGHRPAARRRRR